VLCHTSLVSKSVGLICHTSNTTPPVTAKQWLVIIPYQAEEGIDGYGGRSLRKGVLRRKWKMPQERSTCGPGLEYGDGEELGEDEGSN